MVFDGEQNNSVSFMKKKRKKSGIEEDFQEIQKKIKENKDRIKEDLGISSSNSQEELDGNITKKDSGRWDNTNITEFDLDMFLAIDEIIRTFSDNFRSKTFEEMMDALKKTSFNIQSAYLYLSDPEHFKSNN
jgi:hypothetical protein